MVTRAGQDYVFVIMQNAEGKEVARRVPVKKLITIENDTIISEGLSKGDMIVVDGMDVLVDGARVNRVEK